MTREETGIIMAILKAAFPTYYRDLSRADALSAISLWADMFSDDSAKDVETAVKALIASQVEGFPPTIGAVKAKLRLISEPDKLSEMQAWQMVKKAVKNGLYGSEEEFKRLPPEVKAVVHCPEALKDWARADEDELDTVIASNFMRSFRGTLSRMDEIKALPASVRMALPELKRLEE